MQKGLKAKGAAGDKAQAAKPGAEGQGQRQRKLSSTVYAETQGVYSEVSASASTSHVEKQPGGGAAAQQQQQRKGGAKK